MADIKISALPTASPITGAEQIPCVQSGSTVNITVQKILDAVPVSLPVPDSTATDVAGIVSDFNNMLASFRAAGIIG